MDRHARRGIAAWLVNLGWDACVLALGAAPAVFMSASAANLFGGQEFAIYWGFAFLLVSITVGGGIVGNMRGVEDKHDGHAVVALGIGGALLGTLMWIATSHVPLASK